MASISYERVEASVSYKDNFLSSAIIMPFHQHKKEEAAQQVTMAASSQYVNNGVVNAIATDLLRGAVGFNVKVDAGVVRVDWGSWIERRVGVKVSCEDFKVGLWSYSTAGTLLGGSKPCKVHL